MSIQEITSIGKIEFGILSQKEILKMIQNFGMQWDEKPIIQSDRLDKYKNAVKILVKNKKAYYCFCTQERLVELRKMQKAKGSIQKYDKKCKKGGTSLTEGIVGVMAGLGTLEYRRRKKTPKKTKPKRKLIRRRKKGERGF